MDDAKKRPKLTPEQKRELKAARLVRFTQQIGRKAQKRMEPNDRGHGVEMDRALRRVSPIEIDELISFRDDDA